jgi:hypothetical protein
MSAPLTLGARVPNASDADTECASLIIESDFDTPSEIESLSLKSARPLAEQKSDWNKLREMLDSWKPREITLNEAA